MLIWIYFFQYSNQVQYVPLYCHSDAQKTFLVFGTWGIVSRLHQLQGQGTRLSHIK